MNNTKSNKKRILTFIKILLSLAFMVLILYYFFGKNPDSLQRDLLKKVNYIYVILSMVFGAWAYVSRGLRWIVLIDALGYKSSKINSIASVSVGYFTNLFIPRAGEISRCTSLKKSDNIPVDKLFGTILIERVIDFIFLFFFIILAMLLKSGEIIRSVNAYQSSDLHEASSTKFIVLGFIVLAGVILYLFKNRIKQLPSYQKVANFIEGLKEGVKSIKQMKNKTSFWFHTLGIWIMYFLMTYICFQAIPETSHLTISDGLFLLALGGIGMIIPTPGGFGSYHFIVMIGLIALRDPNILVPDGFLPLTREKLNYDEYNPAMLFPFIVHTAQTFVAIIMGSISLFILFLTKKKKHESS